MVNFDDCIKAKDYKYSDEELAELLTLRLRDDIALTETGINPVGMVVGGVVCVVTYFAALPVMAILFWTIVLTIPYEPNSIFNLFSYEAIEKGGTMWGILILLCMFVLSAIGLYQIASWMSADTKEETEDVLAREFNVHTQLEKKCVVLMKESIETSNKVQEACKKLIGEKKSWEATMNKKEKELLTKDSTINKLMSKINKLEASKNVKPTTEADPFGGMYSAE